MDEIMRNVEQCRKCKYSMAASVDGGYICDYLGIVGKMRDCDTWPKCEKFEKKGTIKNKLIRTSADGGVRVRKSVPVKQRKVKKVMTEVDKAIVRSFSENRMNVLRTAKAFGCTEVNIRYHLKKVGEMKAVLISIQPKWCELIASRKKTVEVRKTRPNMDVPFKCYIYCTLSGSNEFFKEDCNGDIAEWNKSKMALKKGKVIGEFACDSIEHYTSNCTVFESVLLPSPSELEEMCLTLTEFNSYGTRGKLLYGWHISDLVIYDRPKELSEFYKKCEGFPCEGCEHLKYQRVNADEYDYECEFYNFNYHIPITRPPQSWCYVEELRKEDEGK